MKTAAFLSALLLVGCATPETFTVREDFGPGFDAKKFLTPLPNKNTSVRDGVMWTRGSSGGKYPPMVYLPVQGKDLAISFRYRHLGVGGLDAAAGPDQLRQSLDSAATQARMAPSAKASISASVVLSMISSLNFPCKNKV